jgi:hypothetical protein
MVHAPDRLSKHVAHFQHLQLRAACFVLRLIDRVCHNDFVQGAGVDAIDRVAAQDAVRDERVHLGCAFLLQQLCRACDGVRSVCQVIDKDGRAVRDVSHQHHGRVLAVVDLCWSALLVDEGKGHAERVGDGGRTFGTACVWADYDGLLVVGDVELDVLSKEVAAIEVVDRDVEEALVLRV